MTGINESHLDNISNEQLQKEYHYTNQTMKIIRQQAEGSDLYAAGMEICEQYLDEAAKRGITLQE